jgi:YVTN family beta-propeller protein
MTMLFSVPNAPASASPSCIGTGHPIGDIAVDQERNLVYAITNPSIATDFEGVFVINGTDNEILRRIPLTHNPLSIGINERTNIYYIGFSGSQYQGYVQVFNAADHNLIATVQVQETARHLAVNSKTNMIYVSNFWSDSVSVIDGRTNSVVKHIAVGRNPDGIAVNPETNLVYVTAGNAGRGLPYDNRVFVINGSSLEVAQVITVGERANDVAVNPETNKVFVSNYRSFNLTSTVSVIDADTNEVVSTIDVGGKASSVQVDTSSNRVYVLNTQLHLISVIDGNSNGVLSTISIGEQVGEDALAVNSRTGALYVGRVDTYSIVAIDSPSEETALEALQCSRSSRSIVADYPFVSTPTTKSSFSDIWWSVTSVPFVIVALFLAALSTAIMLRFEKKVRSSARLLTRARKHRHTSHERSDFHPRTWVSRFRKTSLKDLLIMGFFYHAIGLALGYGGLFLIEELNSDYETPELPFSLIDGLLAGPIEETIFFGIPFYLSGNLYVALGTGAIWALLHVFNSEILTFNNLAYGNFLFAVPHLIFSLRTWASGKGWFAIAFHTAWNGLIFSLGCASGDIPCTVLPKDISFTLVITTIVAQASIIFAEVLLLITYLLYKWRRGQELDRALNSTQASLPA